MDLVMYFKKQIFRLKAEYNCDMPFYPLVFVIKHLTRHYHL